MTGKRWFLLFLLTALVCAGVLLWQLSRDSGRIVTISQDGTVLYTIDLSQLDEPYTLTVSWQDGCNQILVTPETVQVTEATCSSQVCVHHGPLEAGGSPIVCLPHHLTIRWAESAVGP